MPQLELHNVPKRAGPPTGAATGQINSTASPLFSFKLQQRNVQNAHCIYEKMTLSISQSNKKNVVQWHEKSRVAKKRWTDDGGWLTQRKQLVWHPH